MLKKKGVAKSGSARLERHQMRGEHTRGAIAPFVKCKSAEDPHLLHLVGFDNEPHLLRQLHDVLRRHARGHIETRKTQELTSREFLVGRLRKTEQIPELARLLEDAIVHAAARICDGVHLPLA